MLEEFFADRLATLPATHTARAYLVGLMVAQAMRPVDYSDTSVVLTYGEVAGTQDVQRLQGLGDWVLWVCAMYPRSLVGFQEVTQSVGRASYYRCYRMVPEWRVYEELADNLPMLARHLYAQIGSRAADPTMTLD